MKKSFGKAVLCTVLTVIAVCFMIVKSDTQLKAYATDETLTYGDFSYVVEDGIAYIYYCDESASGTVTVPGKIDGYPVCVGYGEGVNYMVFLQDDITKIVVSDGAVEIRDAAMSGCSGLEEVVLPETVKEIGNFAFRDCTKLRKVNIPSEIQRISAMSFENTAIINDAENWTDGNFCYEKCLLIMNHDVEGDYTVADGIKHIGSNSLDVVCGYIENLVLPDSVVTICDDAAFLCSVRSVNIPENVVYIGEDFMAYDVPNKITVDPENKYYTMYEGYLCDKDCTTIIRCTRDIYVTDDPLGEAGVESLIIPEGITMLGSSAFSSCDKIKEYVLPSTLKEIGSSAFRDNRYMHKIIRKIVIPESVEKIGRCAFEDSDFDEVEIKGSVKRIELGTFRDMKYLKKVILPDSVEFLGTQSFMLVPELNSVSIPASVKEIEFQAFYKSGYYNNEDNWDNGVLYLDEYLLSVDESLDGMLEVKNGTKLIAACAMLECCKIESVKIPVSLKYINRTNFNASSAAGVKTVYYCGSKAQWQEVSIGAANDKLKEIPVHYNSDQSMHTYKNVITKATMTKNGKIETKCIVCDKVSKTTTIYSPKIFTLSSTSYIYDGKVKTPKVTIKDNKGKTLVKNTDYTLSSESGRKHPGEYTITITFKGNYSGTKRLSFTVKPRAVTRITSTQTTGSIKLTWSKVTGATGYRVYRYNEKTKAYDIKKDVAGTSITISKLEAGKKYKFRIRAFTKDGSTTIWAADSTSVTVATKPVKVTGLKAVQSTSAIKLSWSGIKGATGYRIYRYNPKTKAYDIKKDVSGTSLIIKKLSAGKKYKFKVRACINTDLGTLWGEASDVIETATKPAKPSLKVTSSKKGTATLKWTNVSGETGYQVCCSTKKDSGYKLIGSVKANTSERTVSKLTVGKIYYFRVRAFVKTASGKVYSSWSDIKSVRVYGQKTDSSLTTLKAKAKKEGAYMAVAYLGSSKGDYADMQNMFKSSGITKKYPFIKDIPESRFFCSDGVSNEIFVLVPVDYKEVKIYECNPGPGIRGDYITTIKDGKPFVVRGGTDFCSNYIVETVTKSGERKSYEADLGANIGKVKGAGYDIYDFTLYELV